ncbi:MAG: phosphoadenosine phosphosulfate reductase [Lentisphaerae bacterium RIFOXYB12_FULL_65_16]|nr:MAG: phosphoadenosine phosphosulfate reductase [Lentisphaerae bacterium RIFOXYA12_64_32]OGV84830.1 MAG: phosphoadenosine phosphosulfate reductase [Lentisphaerae bacterium RIFOXYB12_FULL_65_16]
MAGSAPEAVLAWAAQTFGDRVVFGSSLGAEDQVLVHMIATVKLQIPVFTLDTGRLFAESYDLMAQTEERYGIRLQVFCPDAAEVEALVAEHGPNLFRKSVALRRLCCEVRKIHPLRRALAGKAAWICGLRADQSMTRSSLQVVEWDAANGLFKISPLAGWTDAAVWSFVRTHQVPCNPLHERGYPSIGCACCTRAVAPGEDVRAGRWSWETPEKKECGLHAHAAASAARSACVSG